MNERKLITVSELAEMLQVSEKWVYDHAQGRRRPSLPALKMGKAVRFRREDVDAFLDKCAREVA